MQRDSLLNTLVVSLALCIICSLIVSVSAVGLRSFQDANKVLDQKRNIISAASLAP
jgi:Na+-transporting NADH:ubiquinone oxidoreductase subunit C